jgi:hypothetical protein
MSIVNIITTSSCMACTIPFNITNNNTNNEYTEKTYENKYDPYVLFREVLYYENTKPNKRKDKNRYSKSNKSYKVTYKFNKFNKNKENRKIHNIHQPGRTNCSQRWFS